MQSDVTLLIRSLAEVDSEDSDLDLTQLSARRRKAQEDDLEAKLNTVKYGIDSTDAIKLFGSGRIENVCYQFSACVDCSHQLLVQFLLPLLYLVLKRHLQIMKLASTVILVERELQFATQSIQNIFGGVDLRVKQLEGALPCHIMMRKYEVDTWTTYFPSHRSHILSAGDRSKNEIRLVCAWLGSWRQLHIYLP